ncbi:MAG: AEC family transporter [Solobacterium sp.]|nr:AEC family transporter [Solobacterium sp.]
MSDVVMVLIQQVIVMGMLMVIGFIAYRTKLINSEGVKQMSNIALYVATPAILINSFLAEFDVQRLIKAGWTAVLSFVTFLFGLILVKTVFRKLNNVGKFGVLFSNVGFMGIPLVQMVLGQEAVFYMAMVVAVMTLTTFTYGMYLITGDKASMSLKKVITNPPIIGVIVGILIYCFRIPLPSTVVRTCSMLANVSGPISMMVLGSYLAEADMKSVFGSKDTYLILLGRLILVPGLMLVTLKLLPGSLDDIKAVILIAASTPVATALGMFSQLYGGNYAYGAGVVSLSTILSLVTMPLLLALL